MHTLDFNFWFGVFVFGLCIFAGVVGLMQPDDVTLAQEVKEHRAD